MAQQSQGDTPLRSEHDIVLARQLVRKLTQELAFSLVDQTKMVTAASELARNALIYGRGGTMHWEILQGESARGLDHRGLPVHARRRSLSGHPRCALWVVRRSRCIRAHRPLDDYPHAPHHQREAGSNPCT